jgi:hypothetical protein
MSHARTSQVWWARRTCTISAVESYSVTASHEWTVQAEDARGVQFCSVLVDPKAELNFIDWFITK